MFEIGDQVILAPRGELVYGEILSYRFDEGNVWTVVIDDGTIWECSDDDLEPVV